MHFHNLDLIAFINVLWCRFVSPFPISIWSRIWIRYQEECRTAIQKKKNQT